MDKLLLKRAAIQSVALMLVVVTLSYGFNQYHAVTISASNTQAYDDALSSNEASNFSDAALTDDMDNQTLTLVSDNLPEEDDENLGQKMISQYMEGVNPNILKQMEEHYLVIKKPLGSNLSIQLEDLYITKSIQIELTGLDNEEMNSQMIGRALKEEAFIGDPVYTETVSPDSNTSDDIDETVITKVYGDDFVHGITITNEYDEVNKSYTSNLLIELDNVYVQILQEDKQYYYIELKHPREVYDKILVIDAGHGGKDGGALSKGEKYCEKNINLEILLQLKELLDKEDIKVYYTRTGDDKVFLRPRAELANAVDCDFFISIHCNANEVSWPNGTEVFYYDTEFKGVKAKDLANLFLDELAKATTLEKRYLVLKKDKDIFILHHSVVPSILIEVGYVTNTNDMNYLSQVNNRKAIAQGIYNGIMKAYEMYTVSNDGL